mgnify:CR=1 FL=1
MRVTVPYIEKNLTFLTTTSSGNFTSERDKLIQARREERTKAQEEARIAARKFRDYMDKVQELLDSAVKSK